MMPHEIGIRKRLRPRHGRHPSQRRQNDRRASSSTFRSAFLGLHCRRPAPCFLQPVAQLGSLCRGEEQRLMFEIIRQSEIIDEVGAPPTCRDEKRLYYPQQDAWMPAAALP
jgi:hypothetical protein